MKARLIEANTNIGQFELIRLREIVHDADIQGGERFEHSIQLTFANLIGDPLAPW